MDCGPNYPKEPPVIHFVSQINLPGVNNTDGLVDQNAVGILRDWERIATELSKHPRPKEDPLSLEAALIAIRKSVTPVLARQAACFPLSPTEIQG
jgi:ubiquitin-conjugating enzyme E2 variant